MQTKRRLLSTILTLCYFVTVSLTSYVAAAPATGASPGNLAYNATVTGSNYDSTGQSTGGWWGGSPFSLQNITSGTLNTDLWVAPHVSGTSGTPGDTASVYLLIDLGTEKTMNVIKIWNYYRNHPASGLRTYHNQIVQLSADGINWVNVFNQDVNDVAHQDPKDSNQTFANETLVNGTITGVSAGNDAEYQEDTNAGGHQIDFAPTTARYIRWWSGGETGTISNNNLPQMVQLQAYYMNTVTYDYNDGVNPSTTVNVSSDTVLTKPNDPVSQTLGQVFDGWTVDVAGGTAWDFSQPVTGDMKLVANWKTVPVYTVKFSYSENAEPMTVKVTKGNTVTPPEGLTSDGMVLAGWKLKGVPYDFSTPIIKDVTLAAIWVPVPSQDAYVIPAGVLNIVLNSAGQITKLINTLDGTDYVTTNPDGKASYLMSLIVNNAPQYPTAVHYAKGNGTLTLDFASVKGKATVNIDKKGGYTTFTLTDLKLPSEWSAQAVLWGPIKIGIKSGGQVAGVAYNDKFGIGIHSLNNKTVGGWPVEFNNLSYPSDLPNVNGYLNPLDTRGFNNIAAAFSTWGSALQAYTWDYTKPTERKVQEWNAASPTRTIPALTGDYAGDASMIGSSIALFGTRTPNILNVLSNIEVNEGLPHPTINGKWQKTSQETAQDFLVFTDNMYNNIVNDSKMALDAGINYIYGQYGASGPWITDGGFQFNGNFGGSDAAAKQMVDTAASYGVKVGVHTLSNEISPGDATYIQPLASAGLASAGIAHLTRPMSDTDTTVYIDNGKEFSPAAVSAADSNSVLIDNEMIAFSTCTQVSDNEWQLTGVVRGYRATTVSAHDTGAAAKLLWFYYDRYIADMELNKQMTDRMVDIFNNVGVHAMSYDALEATKMTTYGPLQFSEFPIAVYNRINEAGNKDGFITEASDMGSNLWDVQSRISWGESDTPVNLISNYLEFYGLNFMPKMLGWTYTHGNHGASNEPNLLMNLAMKAGWNAGTGWYVTASTFQQRPYMAKEIKLWNNAIKHGAFVVGGDFTSAVQADMRKSWSNGKIWRITEVVPDQQWTLQQVTKDTNFTPIGNPITLHATNNINVVQSANGDIATSTSLDYSRAHSSDTVKIYTQAYSGFQLVEATLTVTGADNTVYPITASGDGTYTFQMPSQDVTITAQFSKVKN
ncbi:InlB B-repeat-containing protein [Paenibacillus sp. KQZ6P-2]|uniref:InlB B-repeat-containing protein n=1 Tax=Paenibacillus mangrovi TaxID=2931978 RepID=A0A9X2B0P6_9BACL|nr:InlB B-repeat-containing protein [Paenibacillus mangrovi]MCJ8010441.1 InlB B-repeat-containing protein [Paenibacillus mangrovi]